MRISDWSSDVCSSDLRRSNISKQPAVVSFGSVNGGIRYNLIPDSVQLVGTIRTFDEAMRARIHADLDNVANHVAAAHGAPVTTAIPVGPGNQVTATDPQLTARMLPSPPPPLGADNVPQPPPQMGAADVPH